MARGSLYVSLTLLLAGLYLVAATKPPNVVFILTDDQDLEMGSLEYMPLLQKHIAQQGTTYGRHYCTTALCCPARASILTGRLAHNHNVTDTAVPFGGYPKVVSEGVNDAYLPIWMQEAGYNTYYAGKLWNAHSLENYDKPFAKGFNGSEFLMDPNTYEFYNPIFQRNHDVPVNYTGQYSTDLIRDFGLAFLDDAQQDSTRPFFLTLAPVAPHSDISFTGTIGIDGRPEVVTSPPPPAKRHEGLFNDVIVPRTPSFNPQLPESVYWVNKLPLLNSTHIEFNDHYYRQRLRSLQAVDEMIEAVVQKLDSMGELENTFIVYTTDNGFHIGQHRLQPGKYCPFEEDIHIPLMVRGPGVPKNATTEIVTTHTDLAPMFLNMVGASLKDDFDGEAIPFTKRTIGKATKDRFEHVQIEYWGYALSESKYRYEGRLVPNNTYKAVRIVSEDYNLYYSIWCNNEHELYDMKSDPHQTKNLYLADSELVSESLTQGLDVPVPRLISRLDALLMVLKTCKTEGCVRPWKQLHPDGGVKSLKQALDTSYDAMYDEIPNVRYDHCSQGYFLEIEGPIYGNT